MSPPKTGSQCNTLGDDMEAMSVGKPTWLLDLLNVEEIRVVHRSEGATTVRRLKEAQKDAVRRGLLRLGEVMVAEGLQQELGLSEDAAS